MHPNALRTLLLVATLAAALPAHAGKAHNHGIGTLNVAIDREQLSIQLEMPLDAATGFERAPKNEAEKAALRDTGRLLQDGAALFRPSAAAGCTLAEVQVNVPHLDGRSAGEHADIEASYRFRCTNPGALNGIETALFSHFRRLYRLEVQRIGPTGQGSGRLTPKQPQLRW